MKSKTRITAAATKEAKTSVPESPTTRYNAFIVQFRDTNTPTKFLREKYKELFKTPVPAALEELIKAKISYHLLVVEGYQKCNVPVPEKVMKNYLASKDLDIEGFSDTMGAMLKLNTVKTETEKEGVTLLFCFCFYSI